ncbi:VacB/RNase II family 3'-5' exoribonuclease [Paenibacillus pasadenensis]|uniref:VacB/RNase II family 3'-5' exoribonuclease n=1 Tax=Paenibacillus pasadenensis TaxID=217090 RepID=UPI002041B4DC|nr:VacB/RNase II family 3'-5' exoribonuclease [Paenibacillus pasadenensis]MCM3749358.1 VacB/RNase II family 3'-5' exoribonuclease [Paenibacillus pasadenensis]
MTIEQQSLLDLMNQPAYKPMTYQELERQLGINNASDFKAFLKLLNELEEKGAILRSESGAYGLPQHMNLLKGRLQVHAKGFAFLLPEDKAHPDVYIGANDLNTGMNGDTVLVRVTTRGPGGGRMEGEVVRIAERAVKQLVGTFESHESFGFVSPDDKRINRDIFIPQGSFGGAVTGMKVVANITNYPEGRSAAQGEIIEVLGHKNDPGVDILSIIRKHQLPESFPDEVMDEAEAAPDSITEEEIVSQGRRDLRDKTIVTIDGEDAKDLDDAVNIERLPNGNYLLGVHIADVSYYVRERSALDQEAYRRGTSVYLTDRVIPMLPHRLSNGICSLHPKVDRLTMSCEMEFDAATLKRVRHDVFTSVIRSKERMSYTNVRKILTPDEPEELDAELTAQAQPEGEAPLTSGDWSPVSVDEAEFDPSLSVPAEKLPPGGMGTIVADDDGGVPRHFGEEDELLPSEEGTASEPLPIDEVESEDDSVTRPERLQSPSDMGLIIPGGDAGIPGENTDEEFAKDDKGFYEGSSETNEAPAAEQGRSGSTNPWLAQEAQPVVNNKRGGRKGEKLRARQEDFDQLDAFAASGESDRPVETAAERAVREAAEREERAARRAEKAELLERYAELVPTFQLMEELAMKLRRQRMKRGAIDFDFQESKIIVDEEGKPIDIVKRERSIAEMIIEEFMLAANETVSEHFYWLKVPFLYRIHENPDGEKLMTFIQIASNFGYGVKGKNNTVHPKALQSLLEEIKGTKEETVLSTMMLRSMKQARYDAQSLGHYGLAAEYYSHFTSPIRRYPDLVIHRVIREVLENGGMLSEARIESLAARMPDIAQQSSERERVAVDAERDTDQLKKCEFMLDKVGEEFTGIISSVTGFGIFVELPNTVEGLIRLSSLSDDYYHFDDQQMILIGERTSNMYRIGDEVKVRVERVDMDEHQIDFAMVEGGSRGAAQRGGARGNRGGRGAKGRRGKDAAAGRNGGSGQGGAAAGRAGAGGRPAAQSGGPAAAPASGARPGAQRGRGAGEAGSRGPGAAGRGQRGGGGGRGRRDSGFGPNGWRGSMPEDIPNVRDDNPWSMREGGKVESTKRTDMWGLPVPPASMGNRAGGRPGGAPGDRNRSRGAAPEGAPRGNGRGKGARGPSISGAAAAPADNNAGASAPQQQQEQTSSGAKSKRKRRKGSSTAPSIREVTRADIADLFRDMDAESRASVTPSEAAPEGGGGSKRSRSRRKKNKGGAAGAPPVSGGDAGVNSSAPRQSNPGGEGAE